MLGAGDTFRAAAVEQLTIWSERLGVGIVTGEPGSHPASVAYRAVEQAIKNGTDVCIVDTAGRLQTQKNLMAELTKIQDSIRKQLPEAPHEVLLVLDATTGQNGISQAMKFTEAVNCTGIVLAKLDGTAKGGVVVAIRQQVGLPVKYLGVGEQPEDLTPFTPDEFVDALFAGLAETRRARRSAGVTRKWACVPLPLQPAISTSAVELHWSNVQTRSGVCASPHASAAACPIASSGRRPSATT